MELSHLLTIWQMIPAPSSLIQVVFTAEADKSEFQGRLPTPGNFRSHKAQFFKFRWVLFPPLPPPMKSGGRGGVMFSEKYRFRKSHGRLGNFQYEGKMIGLKKKRKKKTKKKKEDPCTWDWKSSLGYSLKNIPLRGINKNIQQVIGPPIRIVCCMLQQLGSYIFRVRSLLNDFSQETQPRNTICNSG